MEHIDQFYRKYHSEDDWAALADKCNWGGSELRGAEAAWFVDDGREPLKALSESLRLLGYAERRTRAAIATWPDGTYRAEDVVEGEEGPIPLAVAVTVAGDTLTFDFRGTAGQVVIR